MADRYSEEWKAGLLDPERKLLGLGVAEFLEEAGLGPGMTMVDYGCGPGFVTLQAAKMVGPAGRGVRTGHPRGAWWRWRGRGPPRRGWPTLRRS